MADEPTHYGAQAAPDQGCTMAVDANDEDELTLALLKTLRGAREREEALKKVLTRATDAIVSLASTVGSLRETVEELRGAVALLAPAVDRLEKRMAAIPPEAAL